jgi:hypothetical protein
MGVLWELSKNSQKMLLVNGEKQSFQKKDRYAWQKWIFAWQAEPGEYILRCRASDMNGNI